MALQELRAELKRWEHSFQEKHSRAPAKTDVQACASIRKLYSEYSRLKSGVVETSHAEKPKPDEKTPAATEIAHTKRTSSRKCKVQPPEPDTSRQAAPRSDATNSGDIPDQANPSPQDCFLSQRDHIPSCPSALEEGLLIRLQQHGSHFDSNEGELLDDPLPAGFRSTFGPSSFLNKNLQTCRIFSPKDTNALGDDDAKPETGASVQLDEEFPTNPKHQSKRQKLPEMGNQIAGRSKVMSDKNSTAMDVDDVQLDSSSSARLDADSQIKPGHRLKQQIDAENGSPSAGTGSIPSLEDLIARDIDDAELASGSKAQMDAQNQTKLTRRLRSQKSAAYSGQGAGRSDIQSLEKLVARDIDDAKLESGSTGQLDAENHKEQGPKLRRRRVVHGGTQSLATVTRARRKLFSGSGERDNFVKMNLNGRGKRKRKFVSGVRVRRTGAYSSRRAYATRQRKHRPIAEAGDEAPAEDTNGAQAVGRKAAERSDCVSSRSESIWLNDGWLERDASESKDKEDTIAVPPEEWTGKLRKAVEAARKNASEKNLLEVLRLGFSFTTFRAGQLDAIKRVVSSQSTMVVLPTGSGKSLCYQLPAHILPGLILVISPLMALMTDQLNHLPPTLPGALISSGQTPQESSATLDRLRAGQVKILFISPERLFSESFHSILAGIPSISLAVIDEAHCLSEWSHNFRPSYYRLGKVLRQRMNVPCILAMTATATKKAEDSILRSLCIPLDGVVQNCHVRDNLLMTVSMETNRSQALVSMLQRSPYLEAKSIIVYCTFQAETDRICELLQKNSIQAKSYHAAKTIKERSRVQELFCKNKLRVVVATVAFGMGLDKSDVRAIVHFNMPRSLESYVQETGRGGRDGEPAHCHLFLDSGDYLKLRSLAYSDGVDEYSVNKFLSLVFNGRMASPASEVLGSIVIESTARELDIKEEVMETILSYLEVGDVQYVKVFSKLNATCTLGFHKSRPAFLADRNVFLAAVLKRSTEKQGRHIFDITAVASEIQCSLFDVQSQLRRLQSAGEITYETGGPSLCFTVKQVPADICLLTSEMTRRLREGELCKVKKIDAMYSAASEALQCANERLPQQECSPSVSSQQAALQAYVQRYFQDEDIHVSKHIDVVRPNSSFVQADIKVFLKSARSAATMTGRAVARIFHGLWSPAFPYLDWSKNHFWGRHAGIDFEAIKQAATVQIISQHGHNRGSFAS